MPATAGPQPARAPRLSRSSAPRRALQGLGLCALVSGLSLGLALGPRPVLAAAPSGAAAPANVDAALESGDLTSARELAVSAREADPSAANWAKEAAVHEARGDYAGAIAAWEGHRDALPEDDDSGRAAAESRIADLEERSRGTVADEPASTHRDELDKDRAERLAALQPKVDEPKPKPKPPKPKERIIKKWYFWVTVAALAASAGAITGIAIQAARDEQADD
ncbi:MAG: hypothetical protein KC486_36620, partial [Myxococcales bacterium]|nr:hypothetical protein [Myxococcales bacterium]